MREQSNFFLFVSVFTPNPDAWPEYWFDQIKLKLDDLGKQPIKMSTKTGIQ